jgi:ClpP class serine protease
VEEKILFQNMIEEGYDLFLTRVSEGRKKTKEGIDKVARGRVCLGRAAKEIGLVDEVGGMDVAIKKAAEKAKVENYSVNFCYKYFSWEEILRSVFSYFTPFSVKILEGIFGKNLLEEQLKNNFPINKQNIYNNPQLLAYCPLEKMEI